MNLVLRIFGVIILFVFRILLVVSNHVTFKNSYLEFVTNLNFCRDILYIHHKEHILDSFILMTQNGLTDQSRTLEASL